MTILTFKDQKLSTGLPYKQGHIYCDGNCDEFMWKNRVWYLFLHIKLMCVDIIYLQFESDKVFLIVQHVSN